MKALNLYALTLWDPCFADQKEDAFYIAHVLEETEKWNLLAASTSKPSYLEL